MTKSDHMVLMLDGDASAEMADLLAAQGYHVHRYREPAALLDMAAPVTPSCLILGHPLGDGSSGLDVHAELRRRGWTVPTVFVTANWDVPTVVRAIRAGADEFLATPCEPQDLFDAVASALKRARLQARGEDPPDGPLRRAAALTPRERAIVRMVVAGMLNKEIASELDLALVTVKLDRSRAMRKLGAANATDLARIAALAGITR